MSINAAGFVPSTQVFLMSTFCCSFLLTFFAFPNSFPEMTILEYACIKIKKKKKVTISAKPPPSYSCGKIGSSAVWAEKGQPISNFLKPSQELEIWKNKFIITSVEWSWTVYISGNKGRLGLLSNCVIPHPTNPALKRDGTTAGNEFSAAEDIFLSASLKMPTSMSGSGQDLFPSQL